MRTNLKDNESVVLITTLHWYFLFVPFLIVGVMMILAIWAYIKWIYPYEILLALLLAGAGYIALKIYARSRDIFILTNLRLIDENGVFSVSVKENQLDKINNVSYRQSLVGRIFGFGDVEIQTAAEKGATVYHGLKNPKAFCEALTSSQNNYKQDLWRAQGRDSGGVGQEISGPDTMECPYCAEIIKVRAKICRFCGKEIKR
ncbi:MAG TPA: PH domain-containing protein [Thermodesulfobacteriota bacterium]|nr:PH domain-containing protein [Thermodesulfobacteriota bacterium]